MISKTSSKLSKYQHDDSASEDIRTSLINIIPDELLAYIFSCNGNDVNYSMVCKRWKRISMKKIYRLPLYKALNKKTYITKENHKTITLGKILTLKGRRSSIIKLSDRQILFANKQSAMILEFDYQMRIFFEAEIHKQFNSDQYEWRFLEYKLGKIYFSVKDNDDETYSALSIYNNDGSCYLPFLSFKEISYDINLLSKYNYVVINEDLLLIFTLSAIFKISIKSGEPQLQGVLQDHEISKLYCSNRMVGGFEEYQYNLIKNRLLVQRNASVFLIDIEKFTSIPMTARRKDQFAASIVYINVLPFISVGNVMTFLNHPTTFVVHNNQFLALRMNNHFSKLLCFHLNEDNHWEIDKARRFSPSLYTSRLFRKVIGNASFAITNLEEELSHQPILTSWTCMSNKPFVSKIDLVSTKAGGLKSKTLFHKRQWGHPVDREDFSIDRQGYYTIHKKKNGAHTHIEIGHFFQNEKLEISRTEKRSFRLIYLNEFTLEVARDHENEELESFRFILHL